MTAPRKPSALANLILLVMLLAIVAGLAGGGYYVYKKVIASKKPVPQQGTAPAVTTAPAASSTKPATAPTSPSSPDPTAAAKSDADRIAAQKKAQEEKAAAEKAAAAKAAQEKAAADRMAAEQAAKIKAEAERAAKEAADREAKALADAKMKQQQAAATTPPDTPPADEAIQPAAPSTGRHDAASPEARQFKAEAKRRIDEAPASFTDAEKDEARRKIDRASQLVLISTVKFPRGGTAPTAADKAALAAELAKPEVSDLVGNPLARVVILGFADTAGASQVNRDIAQRRAESIQAVLKGAGIPSGKFERIVPIGETTLLGAGGANRAAEVWIAAP